MAFVAVRSARLLDNIPIAVAVLLTIQHLSTYTVRHKKRAVSLKLLLFRTVVRLTQYPKQLGPRSRLGFELFSKKQLFPESKQFVSYSTYSHGQKKRHPPKFRVFYKYHFNDHEFSNCFAVGIV